LFEFLDKRGKSFCTAEYNPVVFIGADGSNLGANAHLSMRYFFLKLLPPRLDFMQTMNVAEKAIMYAHRCYWAEFAEKGWAVAYGPVVGEHGGFGAGFWALPADVDPEPLTRDDPAMKANVGFRYEISPMPALVIGNVLQSPTS